VTRVALVGVGHWHANLHLHAFLKAGAQIVAVSDPTLELAQRFAQRANCPAFTSVHDILEHTDPDLTVVMGRPTEMPDIVRTLALAGRALLVEKPVARNATELEPLVQLVNTQGVFAAVPFANRCSPLWSALRESRAGKTNDPVIHAHFRIVNGPAQRYVNAGVPWMLEPSICGGGALRNLGIHGVDAFRFAVGDEAVWVEHASIRHGTGHDTGSRAGIDEHALVTLRSASGAVGLIEAGYTFASLQPGGDFEWRIATSSTYLIERDDRLIQASLHDQQQLERPISAQADRYDDFARDTLERLRDGRPPLASLYDCLEAMRLIDTAYTAQG
jgi:predicted dehydrogenase